MGGNMAVCDGSKVALDWYWNDQYQVYVSLFDFCDLMGWDYIFQDTSDMNGHSVTVQYGMEEIYKLTVDGKDHIQDGMLWNNEVFVNMNFLRALDAAEANVVDGVLTFSFFSK